MTNISFNAVLGLNVIIRLLPIVLIGAWIVYIKKYLDAVFEDTKHLWRLYVRIGLTMLCGIATFCSALGIVVYVTQNSNLLDGLYGSIFLKVVVALLWLACTFYGAYCVKRNDNVEQVSAKPFVIALCMWFVIIGYSWWKADDVWYEKMVADYEEHEGETNVEPFLRN